MRFSRLSLHRYGHFADCDLAFPPGAMDFHLIFGANEAGKSTTLAAVSDLLFGFPHTTPYDFRFQGPLLRIGGVLEHDGQRLTLQRRKGKKDTLLDAADAVMPESALQTMLQGFTAETFRISHSLDHRRLRDGGRAILAARDNIGQALFAAGSGLVGVHGLLRDLETEADGIWGARRAARRSYTQAETELKAAQERLKTAEVRPKEWGAARQELNRLIAAQAALEDRRATEQAALRRVQRVRRLAAPAQRRAALLVSIQDLAPPPFDAEHLRIHDQAQEAMTAASLTRRVAAGAAAELRDQLAALTVDEAVIAQQDAINALVAEAGAARQGAEHLPLREREGQALQAEIAHLLRELGLEDAEPDAVRARLPSRIALDALQRLAADRARTETTLEALRRRLAEDRRLADRARAALAEEPLPVLPPEAAAALRDGQRALAVEERLAERRRHHRRATEALDAALTRLKPWSGDLPALAALAPPPERDIAAAETAIHHAAEALAEESRSLLTHSQTRERLVLERQRFAAEKRAITAEQVRLLRSDRDGLWQPIEEHVLAGVPLAAPGDAIARFRAALEAADAIADTRFETVEASARLTAFDDGIALATLDAEQAERRRQAAEMALQRHEQAWAETLTGCGLPMMTIPAARQWRADQADALEAARMVTDAAEALAADDATVAAAQAGLRAVCPDLGAEASLKRCLDAVQRLSDAAARAQSRVTTLEAQAATAAEAVAKAQLTIDDLLASAEAWEVDWAAASTAAGLSDIPWTTMQSRLPLFEQLRGVVDAAREMQGRVRGIRDNQQAFAARARDLAVVCGLVAAEASPQSLAQMLRQRLQKAIADGQVVADLRATLRRRLDEQAEAERLIDAATAQLRPLMELAGTTDREALTRGVETARLVLAARVNLAALEQEILAAGDGHALEQLLDEAGSDEPDALAAETLRLDRSLAALDEEIAATAQAVGEARRAFQALDHGADAALAAADAEQARAAMAAEAEAYLIKRSQVVMLKWAIETYRARRQNPLLARAGQLFATLTLGRYGDLQIDLEGDQPRLVALAANGASSVTVDGMSDGTADQLFLALRLAALEQSFEAGITLPFLADDLFINFDDRRAHAGFMVLGEIARKTQVLFFTHHAHLRAIAEAALTPHTVSACDLGADDRPLL